MGGETDHLSLSSVERYDVRIGQWHRLPSMSTVNSYCTAAVLHDTHIYCCEGLGSAMECFDIRANKWSIINFYKESEFYEIVGVGNNLYSVSGEGLSKYDFNYNEWCLLHTFNEPREWDAVVGLKTIKMNLEDNIPI